METSIPQTMQAFHLRTGFTSLEKCHLCDGGNWQDLSRDAEWRQTIENRTTDPFWHNCRNPLLVIPGLDQNQLMPDSCHLFHLGWGIDLAASGLVLCAKLKVFPGRSLDAKLKVAFSKFLTWCTEQQKTSAISWWSYKKFDMAQKLRCA